MYYEYFGLSQAPFKITPDTDVFFEGGNRGAILEALIYAITHGEGIIKVTGEVAASSRPVCRQTSKRCIWRTRVSPPMKSSTPLHSKCNCRFRGTPAAWKSCTP